MITKHYANTVLQKFPEKVNKMAKKEDFFQKHIEEKERFHDEIVDRHVRKLNDKIRSDKYAVESLLADTTLGNTYHDLLNSKDEMNSKLQRNINQSYNILDIELYKLNKKLDKTSRMINYKADAKKDEVLKKIKYNLI